jgi:hypothetical protein
MGTPRLKSYCPVRMTNEPSSDGQFLTHQRQPPPTNTFKV